MKLMLVKENKCMVRILSFILVAAMFTILLAGCTREEPVSNPVQTNEQGTVETPNEQETNDTSNEIKLMKPFEGAMGTASAVGGWYVIGGGICNVLSQNVEGLTLTPQVTGGSVENVRLLANKENELIMIGGGTADAATKGIEPFSQKYEDINGLFTFGSTATHVVVRKDSDINKIEDLKGKKVAIGPPGSGTERVAQVIFPLAKIENDVKQLPMAFADMYNALRDKNIDAFLLQASPPGPALEELARTIEIRLLNFDDEFIEAIKEADPSYFKGAINKGTYTGVDEDIYNPTSVSFVACSSELPEDVAYNIVKGVYENLEEIHNVHSGAKAIELSNAVEGLNVPIHPGALRYYKETGLIK